MTELEFQRAKRSYAQMTRRSRLQRLASWARGLFVRRAQPHTGRRALLDRKAEVKRKARQCL